MFSDNVAHLLSRLFNQRTGIRSLSGWVSCCGIFCKAAENVTVDGSCYANPKLPWTILGSPKKKKKKKDPLWIFFFPRPTCWGWLRPCKTFAGFLRANDYPWMSHIPFAAKGPFLLACLLGKAPFCWILMKLVLSQSPVWGLSVA